MKEKILAYIMEQDIELEKVLCSTGVDRDIFSSDKVLSAEDMLAICAYLSIDPLYLYEEKNN